MDFRKQLTLTLLGNPGFFTNGLPTFPDISEAAGYLGVDVPETMPEILALTQKVLAVYLDGIVEEIISVGEFDK